MKKLNSIRKILLLTFLCIGSMSYSQNIHDQIMNSIRLELNSTAKDGLAQTPLAAIQPNGSWSDINYSDTSEVNNWEPKTHLNRLFNMANAYSSSQSTYYNNLQLYEAIVNGLNYFYTANPECDNWYPTDIEVPTLLGRILILARGGTSQVPVTTENNILNRLDGLMTTRESRYTGSNKLQFALWYLYKGLLRDSTSEVSYAVGEAYDELGLSTGDGIQHDLSYHLHGPQFYLLGYGILFVNSINDIAKHVQGTIYELNTEQLTFFRSFVLGPFAQLIRGEYASFSGIGRGVSRKNNVKFPSKPFQDLMLVDPAFTSEYQAISNRIGGITNPSDNVTAKNSYLYRSHVTTHNRTGYNFDIRANSFRTRRTEKVNNENLKGRFLADGATNILVKGDEYFNIFPVWDWSKIPGTTVPEYSGSKLIAPVNSGELGVSTFSGGVSEGTYGVQVFDMKDYDTQVKKSWFLFDEEIVCLGSAISSTATETINTTINQSHLDGPVVVSQGGTSSTLSTGNHNFTTGVDWVLHDNIGYFIPNGGNLKLSNQSQSGSWNDINKLFGESATLNMNVFKLWFDHGIKPSNNSYAYIISPGKTTAQQMDAYNLSNINILQNDADIQAVKHDGLDMMQVVFYKAGTLSVGNMTLKVDKACALILKNISTTNVLVSASDPSENNSNLRVSWSSSSISPMKEIQLILPTTTALKGSTVQGTINLSTPNLTVIPNTTLLKLYPVHDAFVRNGAANSNNNYGSIGFMELKRNNVDTGREGFVRFDLSGVSASASVTSVILKMKLRGTHTDAVKTTWDVSSVTDDTWTEATITWNNKPASISVLNNQPGQASGNVEWDVTSFVNSELSGDGKVSLRISSTSLDSSTFASFFSKEDGAILNRPVLELTLTDTTMSNDLNEKISSSKIYPNPSQSEFTVESKTPITQLSIIDITGKTIKSIKEVNSTTLKVDVSNLYKGIYFVKTNMNNGLINTNKIVVK